MSMINGVLKYEHYYAVVECCFPEGKSKCINCTFYDRRTGRCNLTQSICFYPNERRNDDCPLIPKEETE